MPSFNALTLSHRFLLEHVKPGDFCIDATAGRGNDTAFLCELAGPSGQVLAFDIQPEAVACTARLLEERGFTDRARVVADSHSHMDRYAAPSTVNAITFNFGWLPGGDHRVYTRPESSVAALEKGMALLRPDGVMSLCIYYGRENGFTERDALLDWLAGVDSHECSVLLNTFINRKNCPPIAAFLLKGV